MRRKALMAFVVFAWLTLLGVQARSAKDAAVTFPSLDKSKVTLKASLWRPGGTGPFPAMVLMHTCGGIAPYIDGWASWTAKPTPIS